MSLSLSSGSNSSAEVPFPRNVEVCVRLTNNQPTSLCHILRSGLISQFSVIKSKGLCSTVHSNQHWHQSWSSRQESTLSPHNQKERDRYRENTEWGRGSLRISESSRLALSGTILHVPSIRKAELPGPKCQWSLSTMYSWRKGVSEGRGYTPTATMLGCRQWVDTTVSAWPTNLASHRETLQTPYSSLHVQQHNTMAQRTLFAVQPICL